MKKIKQTDWLLKINNSLGLEIDRSLKLLILVQNDSPGRGADLSWRVTL